MMINVAHVTFVDKEKQAEELRGYSDCQISQGAATFLWKDNSIVYPLAVIHEITTTREEQ